MKALLLVIASVAAAADIQGCYKNSTVRGAGVPLSTCPPGSDKGGLLCYPECKPGYTGVGPVCWQNCVPPYTDTGAFCQEAIKWGNNTACPWDDKCGLFHKCVSCPITFSVSGCLCTSGHTFAKDSYGRGVGSPMICNSRLEQSGGLCYPHCGSGYSGDGPVCWAGCPANLPYACGATCLADSTACKDVVERDALDLLELGLEIGLCVVSEGAGCDMTTLAESVAKIIKDLAFPICSA